MDDLDYRIEVSFNYTVNLQDFEFAKIQIGLKRNLKKGETKEEAIDEEFNFIQDKVFDKIEDFLDENDKRK